MYAWTNDSGQALMDSVDNFASMVPTVRNDFATWTSKGPNDYELHVTEFGYFGTIPHTSYEAFFDADMYSSLIEQGVKSVDFWEMISPTFIGGEPPPQPGSTFYASQLMSLFADTGDDFVGTMASVD